MDSHEYIGDMVSNAADSPVDAKELSKWTKQVQHELAMTDKDKVYHAVLTHKHLSHPYPISVNPKHFIAVFALFSMPEQTDELHEKMANMLGMNREQLDSMITRYLEANEYNNALSERDYTNFLKNN